MCAALLKAQVRSFRFQKTQNFDKNVQKCGGIEVFWTEIVIFLLLSKKCSNLCMCPVSEEEHRVACCVLIHAMQRKSTSGFVARAIASNSNIGAACQPLYCFS